ncbi:hypothetical protein SAMN05421812_12153 [Asanoa hainanensis]|uniref:Uncharacterized protein n=1 Tax=Asanoa hainanensis TaxID=560556 RepID=A0A239PEJ4_9ACTN|nr:hypothetical protein SAMN05421812_12153 [Asanoa hainanensis]
MPSIQPVGDVWVSFSWAVKGVAVAPGGAEVVSDVQVRVTALCGPLPHP